MQDNIVDFNENKSEYISFEKMNQEQKSSFIQMLEDKFKIILTEKHVISIFGNTKDSTFYNWSYDSKKGYVESFDRDLIYSRLWIVILGRDYPNEQSQFNHDLEEIHNFIQKENWYLNLYDFEEVANKLYPN